MSIADDAAMTIMTPQLARKLFLLSLLLLVPGVSLAAQEPPPVPGTAAPAPVRLLDVPSQQRVHPALRVTAQVGGAAATSFGIGVAAFFLALSGDDGLGDFGEAETGWLLASAIGAPLGAWWAGELVDGNGTFAGTLVGAAGGLLLGALASLPANENAKFLLYPIGAVIGSVIGYEVSASRELKAKASAASASFQPLLGVSGNGAVLGLGGRF